MSRREVSFRTSYLRASSTRRRLRLVTVGHRTMIASPHQQYQALNCMQNKFKVYICEDVVQGLVDKRHNFNRLIITVDSVVLVIKLTLSSIVKDHRNSTVHRQGFRICETSFVRSAVEGMPRCIGPSSYRRIVEPAPSRTINLGFM